MTSANPWRVWTSAEAEAYRSRLTFAEAVANRYGACWAMRPKPPPPPPEPEILPYQPGWSLGDILGAHANFYEHRETTGIDIIDLGEITTRDDLEDFVRWQC